MIDLATFRFLTPSWLLLLPPLWWLLWMLAKYNLRQSMWNRVCDPHLLDKMQADEAGSNSIRWLIWSLAIVLTFAVLAAAGPSWRQQTHPVMESASARIIALDLSRAMLVEDVKPSRFAQAIAATREIIDADFDGETGLVVFSGAAFVVSPLSRDANTLLAFVDALEPDIMPLDGNRIDLAIARAQDLLLASISGKGQIIIITSGTGHYSRAAQAALNARTLGHQVSIMAIGTVAGGPLIGKDGALVKDGQGKFVLARTNFTELQGIADAGNGFMVSLTEATTYHELLGSRIRADNLVEASKGAEDDHREAANDGIWLVWMMLPFALLLFRRNLIWVILIALTLPLDDGLLAAEADTIWQHREHLAFAAYQQGDFERSAEWSVNALLKGSAYYRNGDYQQAIEQFSLDDSAQSHYNRGNSLTRLNRLPEAIAAYTEALALEPGLSEARYNKRLLELYLARQRESEGEQSAESDGGSGDLDQLDQSTGENRPGVVAQAYNNPGDEQQLEPGFGAALQSGPLDPFEQFDGREQQLERFSLGQGIDRAQAEILVKNWIKNLHAASSELFRRKFLRDFQRQQQQSR
jgi:Ca-activated chloride channel family protein